MKNFAKSKPNATNDEVEAEKEARVTTRFIVADSLKRKWYDQPVKDVLVAFILCGAPGHNLPALTGDASPETVAKGKRGRQAMRQMENRPPANNGGGPSTPSVGTLASEKVHLKRQAIQIYAHNTRKNDLELYMRQLQARGLENTEEYKKCDDELFALLRQSIFPLTPAPTTNQISARVPFTADSTSSTSNREEEAAEDEIDLQEQGAGDEEDEEHYTLVV